MQFEQLSSWCSAVSPRKPNWFPPLGGLGSTDHENCLEVESCHCSCVIIEYINFRRGLSTRCRFLSTYTNFVVAQGLSHCACTIASCSAIRHQVQIQGSKLDLNGCGWHKFGCRDVLLLLYAINVLCNPLETIKGLLIHWYENPHNVSPAVTYCSTQDDVI